jgi:SPP1 gp7 family putative phage head morphogenesis protein
MIRFTKAHTRPLAPIILVKAKGGKKTTLNRLRAFLNTAEPNAIQMLVSFWGDQANKITYKELREAYLNGNLTQAQLEQWQEDYSRFVNEQLTPQWQQAMTAAAQEVQDKYPLYLYDPLMQGAQAYIQQQGAALVTNLVQEQRDALQHMIAMGTQYDGMTADEMSRIMRPAIGLTKPQAAANLRYYTAMKTAYIANGVKQSSAIKKAQEQAAKYAARQHRYRAMSIARTELASAYNNGAYNATRDAQSKGYIGQCYKVWLTADDERTCPICQALDGQKTDMDGMYSGGYNLPPAHPSCRCAVAYEEIPGTRADTPQNQLGSL